MKCGLGLIAVRDVLVRALADSTAKSTVAKLEDSIASVVDDLHDGSYVAGDELGNLTEAFSWCKRSVLLWSMCNSRTSPTLCPAA